MSGPARNAAPRSGIVTLSGWTNVGKSTLLNRLIGEKVAAVADAPQTTRNRITGVLTLPGRAQAVFVDTPGLHHPRHRMNRLMVDLAQKSLAGVDLILLVVDAARGLGDGDRSVARIVRAAGAPALGILNKIDLVAPKTRLLPLMDTLVREWGLAAAVPVSAQTGEGCDLLLDEIVARLPEGPFLFADDYLTDQPERVLVAEWIREKVLHPTREELPHATAVTIDRWEGAAEFSESDFRGLAKLFWQLVDYRSRFTATHTSGVAAVAAFLAPLAGVTGAAGRRVAIAAGLHDLGKLAVPSETLDKERPLCREEHSALRDHPLHGWRILGRVRGLEEVNTWASYHHERLDAPAIPSTSRGR